ncbi:MAG: hypothetical protein GX041_06340 [Clostridiales bacterium]|nr:hypothetical protein [Clostridiales bacterium]
MGGANNANTYYIIRGNSGSGKSSVAKMLQRKIGRNTLVISQDIVRREMLRVHDGKDFWSGCFFRRRSEYYPKRHFASNASIV